MSQRDITKDIMWDWAKFMIGSWCGIFFIICVVLFIIWANDMDTNGLIKLGFITMFLGIVYLNRNSKI